jgi:hypothetical protein
VFFSLFFIFRSAAPINKLARMPIMISKTTINIINVSARGIAEH